jgi:hypothetical protein
MFNFESGCYCCHYVFLITDLSVAISSLFFHGPLSLSLSLCLCPKVDPSNLKLTLLALIGGGRMGLNG